VRGRKKSRDVIQITSRLYHIIMIVVFWKSALIMASRYPRERDEVDRKKRRAADTIHFLFP
jgi:hypothetical protein